MTDLHKCRAKRGAEFAQLPTSHLCQPSTNISGRRVRSSPQQPMQGEVQAVRGRGQQLQPLRLQQLDLHRLGQPQVESKLKFRPPSAVAASSAPSPGGWDNRPPDLKHERGEQLWRRVRPTLILRRKPVSWGLGGLINIGHISHRHITKQVKISHYCGMIVR